MKLADKNESTINAKLSTIDMVILTIVLLFAAISFAGFLDLMISDGSVFHRLYFDVFAVAISAFLIIKYLFDFYGIFKYAGYVAGVIGGALLGYICNTEFHNTIGLADTDANYFAIMPRPILLILWVMILFFLAAYVRQYCFENYFNNVDKKYKLFNLIEALFYSLFLVALLVNEDSLLLPFVVFVIMLYPFVNSISLLTDKIGLTKHKIKLLPKFILIFVILAALAAVDVIIGLADSFKIVWYVLLQLPLIANGLFPDYVPVGESSDTRNKQRLFKNKVIYLGVSCAIVALLIILQAMSDDKRMLI